MPSVQAMYAEMQQILHDDGGIIVLMFNNFVSGHSKQSPMAISTPTSTMTAATFSSAGGSPNARRVSLSQKQRF